MPKSKQHRTTVEPLLLTVLQVFALLGTVVKTVSRSHKKRVSAKNSFDNHTRITHRRKKQRTPEDQSAGRARRFALQNEAAQTLPHEKVSRCLRRIVPVAETVKVQYIPDTHSANYRDLKMCSSVWHCPICAVHITEKRRDELVRVVRKHIEAGGSVYMTTWTIQHDRYDDLADLLHRFLEARRKAKGGNPGIRRRKKYGVIGTVSVLEVTWSQENGWHPHVHELVFSELAEIDTASYDPEVRTAWRKAAQDQGLSMNEHGFQLDRTYGAVADYIAKFGHEPAIDHPTPWGVESEMTKGHLKQVRRDEHFTPFAMLAAIADGCEEVRPKFYEYGVCFKGRCQLNYSPGLKDRYKEQEKTDEELMAETEHEAVNLVELANDTWNAVVGNDIRGELLEVARSGRPGGAAVVLNQVQCSVLKRWRVSVLLEDTSRSDRWHAYDLTEITLTIGEPGRT